MLEQELKTAKEQVKYLLQNYPATRNNDFYLQLLWLKKFGHLDELPYIPWEKIRDNSGRLETITRVRRKIQNEEGLFPPDDPVIRARREKQNKMRRAIRYI